MSLSPDMFGASKMGAVAVDLAKMKVKQLADELEWRPNPGESGYSSCGCVH